MRWWGVVARVLGAVALASAAGCGGDDDTAAVTSSSAAPASTASGSSTSGATSTTGAITTTLSTTTTTTAPPTTTGSAVAGLPAVGEVRLVGQTDDGAAAWTVVHAQVSGSAADGSINAALAADAEADLAAWRRQVDGWPVVEDLPSDYFAGFEVTLLDERYLSVLNSGSVYLSGAAHPTGTASAATFDHTTGARLVVADLFTEGSGWQRLLADDARAGLAAEYGELVDASTLDLSTATDFSVFNLTPTGLRLTFADGEIGPHALGTPSVEIPYDRLADVADPDGPLAPFLSD